MDSIRNNAQLKILDVAQTVGQHGNQLLNNQREMSAVAKDLGKICKKISLSIEIEEALKAYTAKNGPPTTEIEIRKYNQAKSKQVNYNQLLEEIQSTIGPIETTMRTVIGVGNSLRRTSNEISAIGAGAVAGAVQEALTGFVKGGIAKDTKVTLGGDGMSKADPHTAAEMEEKNQTLDDILDLSDRPSTE